jgi:hypothetical protein
MFRASCSQGTLFVPNARAPYKFNSILVFIVLIPSILHRRERRKSVEEALLQKAV